MTKTAIIGDVHGMTELAKALVERISLSAGDTLILLGDLVDKGPDPAGTVAYFRDLKACAAYEIILIEANHEDRHIRYRRNLIERPKVAAEMAAAAPELPALHAQLSEDDWGFLESGVPFHHLPGQNILCVHGGVPGDMSAFPRSVAEIAGLTGNRRAMFRKILRTRYVDAETGAYRVKGDEKPGDPFWAETYDGRFGHVVFGHEPFFDGPAEFTHATGIDTGACHGGALTALIVEADGARRYESVKL